MVAQNNYIPEYIPRNLKWYERDGLLTYIDKLKCNPDKHLEDPDKRFKETKIINFETIHKQARSEKISDKNFLKNQTINKLNKTISEKRTK